MRFLIVPDKFKGCLNAIGVAQAMARGVQDVFPDANITSIPLADGGDGTAEILCRALKARKKRGIVLDPIGRKVAASWGLRKKTAYLDLASASGLALIPPSRRNPLKTSSYGTGQLLATAVRAGAREIVLGVGGSATVDGGLGAMKALGIRFLDQQGREISEGGSGLSQLRRIDLGDCLWRGKSIRVTILADVTNPLLGPNGAALVFGPQKGATPAMVRELSRGLKQLDRVIERQFGKPIGKMVSGGAAGGIVAGLVGILGQVEEVEVRVVRGIDFVLEALGVESIMRRADWVLTGEGRLDSQTADGKTVQGVACLARRLRKPVIAFAGKLELDERAMKTMGLPAAFGIAPRSCLLEESFANATTWLRATVHDVMRLIRGAQ